MAADLDMEAPGGEGWGDDAELQLDEGKFSVTQEYFNPDLSVSGLGHIIKTATLYELIFIFFPSFSVSQMASWMPRTD